MANERRKSTVIGAEAATAAIGARPDNDDVIGGEGSLPTKSESMKKLDDGGGGEQKPLVITRMLTEFEKLLRSEDDDDDDDDDDDENDKIQDLSDAESGGEDDDNRTALEMIGSDLFATVLVGTSKQSQLEASFIYENDDENDDINDKNKNKKNDDDIDDENDDAFRRDRKKKWVRNSFLNLFLFGFSSIFRKNYLISIYVYRQHVFFLICDKKEFKKINK